MNSLSNVSLESSLASISQDKPHSGLSAGIPSTLPLAGSSERMWLMVEASTPGEIRAVDTSTLSITPTVRSHAVTRSTLEPKTHA